MWASEVCATFFGNCNGGPPTAINVSIAIDALRVYVPLPPSLVAPRSPRPAAPTRSRRRHVQLHHDQHWLDAGDDARGGGYCERQDDLDADDLDGH